MYIPFKHARAFTHTCIHKAFKSKMNLTNENNNYCIVIMIIIKVTITVMTSTDFRT